MVMPLPKGDFDNKIYFYLTLICCEVEDLVYKILIFSSTIVLNFIHSLYHITYIQINL